ncbi:MAG: hypothetical protein M2R45_04352 [Verrucomicrobia subdivision 3 bacterium]|nr:hypothetical protein [Limisphaerales bacterium]MCS1416056.1 hypothetical protein [Limisphaerales bacterium]
MIFSILTKIIIHQSYPQTREMSMTVKQFKIMLSKILPMTKKDISEYKNVKLTIGGNQAKIKTNLYSVLYNDKAYYMIVYESDYQQPIMHQLPNFG